MRLHLHLLLAGALLVALAFVSVAAGCGNAEATADPFVGTWRQQLPGGNLGSEPLIITKTANGYTGTLVI